MKTGCGYIRVSTHGKQEELSPDAQKRLILEYAKTNDIVIDRFFVDSGISGKSADKRPAFKEMIATCKEASHPYDCVLLWKFSRFARNIDESTYYKSILRQKCNVEVISISEPIEDNMYGRLIEMIITWSDEFYSYNLSGEVKRGMTQHALMGGYNGIVPLGYIKAKGNENIPQIDPIYGPVIQKIFHEIASGTSPANISVELNESGLRTRTGRRFESRNIIYFIRNPFYIGKIRFNNYDNQRYGNMKDADKGQLVLVDGKHEPIVSEALWTAANNTLSSRSIPYKPRSKPSSKHAHWLSGIIKCAHCGGSLGYSKEHLNTNGKTVPAAFVCTNYPKGRCSHTSRINADVASKAVLDNLTEVIGSSRAYRKIAPAQFEEYDERSALEARLDAIQEKEKRIKAAYVNGIDSLEEYQENKKMLSESRIAIEQQLLLLKKPQEATVIDMSDDIKDLVELLRSNSSISDKNEALKSVCDSVIWNREADSLEIRLQS